MKIGVTLGKYAPFHKGHEYVISTALKEMDHVMVIIYNASDITDIPTKIRAKWIQNIFPAVEVVIAEDGPHDTGYTQEIIEMQNKYLKRILQGKLIDSFYSSENYGAHVSEALNCNI
jgi:cytidyltransferase-like protein